MVGLPLLLGLLAALIATQLQASAWRGKAEVLIDPSSVGSQPAGYLGSYLHGQARLARSPALAERVVRFAGVQGISAAQFLHHSSAKPVSKANTLRLSVTYRPQAAAIRLTNVYATEFVRFKKDLDLRATLRVIKARLKKLRGRGLTATPQYEELVQHSQQLQAFGVRFTSASVAKRADSASSFRPHALRNGIIGGLLGTLLGIVLVAVIRIWPKISRSPSV